MRKVYVLLLFCIVISSPLIAQVDTLPVATPLSPRVIRPKVKLKNHHCVSLALHVPVGNFTESHIAGAGLNYLLFTRYYIKVWGKYIFLTANSGVDYYLGKKTEVAGHDFKYGGYIYLYAQVGINVGPILKGGISLTAGPSMGIYRGDSDFGFSAGLFGNYAINSRFTLGPGVTFRKHPGTDALWTVAVRAFYRL